MDNWGLWFILTVLLYVALTRNLKGRAAGVAFFAYFWAAASLLAVLTWHYHQQFLALTVQLQNAGAAEIEPGLLASKLAQHQRAVWMNAMVVAVLLLLPVASYWYDCRKERMAGQPI